MPKHSFFPIIHASFFALLAAVLFSARTQEVKGTFFACNRIWLSLHDSVKLRIRGSWGRSYLNIFHIEFCQLLVIVVIVIGHIWLRVVRINDDGFVSRCTSIAGSKSESAVARIDVRQYILAIS